MAEDEPKKTGDSKPEKKTSEKKSLKEVGGFRLIEKLGQGAMGAVFKAVQVSMDRVVALKILPPSIAKDEKYIERFQREARASGNLNHPNIVLGIDTGFDKKVGLWYFAMEFVDGPTLKDVVKKSGPLPEERVRSIGLQMARALEYAAENGVIHRDIKPDNILQDSDGQAKLADLGLAKRTDGVSEDPELTQEGRALGTPHYMSPEQVRGEMEKVDTRSDIYALGGTLYHLVVGEPPYKGNTCAEIMSNHLTERVPLAHKANPRISEAFSRLLAQMMQKEQDKRVQSPSAVIKMLEKYALSKKTGAHRKVRTTTGPHAGVRATTGPHNVISRRTTRISHDRDSRKAVASKSKPVAPYAAGGGALLVLLLVALMTIGGGDTPKKQRREAGRRSSTTPRETSRKQTPSTTILKKPKTERPEVAEVSTAAPDPEQRPEDQSRPGEVAQPQPVPVETTTVSTTAEAMNPEAPDEKAEAKRIAEQALAVAERKWSEALKSFDEAILVKKDLQAATKVVDRIKKDAALKPLQANCMALQDLVKTFADQKQKEADALKTMVGEKVDWKVGGRPIKGKVVEVRNDTLIVSVSMGSGSMDFPVRVDRLDAKDRATVVPKLEPRESVQFVAAAIGKLTKGNEDGKGARELLGKARGFVLTEHYDLIARKLVEGEANVAAELAWNALLKSVPAKPTKAEARGLVEKLGAWSAEHGKTAFATSKRAEAEGLRSRLKALLSAGISTKGLVARWKLDEGSGDRARNSAGRGLEGAVKGAVWGQEGGTRFIVFDGNDDEVRMPNDRQLRADDSMWTVAAWVRTSAPKGVIVFQGTTNIDHYLLALADGKAIFQISCSENAAFAATGAGAINDGRWHHVLGRRTGLRDIEVWVDGRKAGEQRREGGGQSINQDGPFLIGGNGESERLKGSVRDVLVYRRALSEKEIAALAAGAEPSATSKVATVDGDGSIDIGNLAEWAYRGPDDRKPEQVKHGGRTGVWLTAPRNHKKASRLTRMVSLKAGRRHTLRFDVACRGEDWMLRVRVNKNKVFQRLIKNNGWQSIEVDLSPYAGQEIQLSLYNQPGGENRSARDRGYWHNIRIESGG